MIAVDVEGKVVGGEPPKLELEAPPVWKNQNERPKIKSNFIPPKHRNTAEENRKEFLNFYMAPYRAVKKIAKLPFNAVNKAIKNVGSAIFPTAFEEPNAEVEGYPFMVDKNLKDNWITYKDIPPFEQPEGFSSENKLNKLKEDYANKNAGAHAYNVWKNTEDYFNRQISDANRSTFKKVADVPRYYLSKAAGMGAKYWADWEDVKKDPIGTVWNDPELSQAAKSVVKTSTEALVDYIYPTGVNGLTTSKNALAKDQANAFIDLITDTDAKKSLSKALKTTLDYNRFKEHQNVIRQRAGMQAHNKVDEKYEKLEKFADAFNLVGPYRMDAQKRREKQVFNTIKKQEIKEEINKRKNDTINKNQSYMFTVGGGGGGGFAGSSSWNSWKRGKRRTYFKKYHRQYKQKRRNYWRRNMGYVRANYYF